MAGYRHLSHGFDPVFDGSSRVLVLGSFPSELSRQNDFYYGNPQNRFWRVLAFCAGEEEPADIPSKRELLLSHGIALWDVIEECDIKGSSDASIKNVTPAHIERLLDAASIERVVCNGSVAGRLYRKYLQYRVGLEAEVLPSTSPANASWSFERLCERWAEALGPLPLVEETGCGGAGENFETAGGAPAAGTVAAAPAAAVPVDDPPLSATVSYAVVSTKRAPPASSYGTHRSMQGNKGKDTKPELLVRRRLCDAGLVGYRLHWDVPGRPDIAWPGKRVAIFINGCFWHRCPYCKPPMPKSNVEYWTAKFARNVERDENNLRELREKGWTVHVIWECQLKKDVIDETFAELLPILAEELGKSLRAPSR